MPRSSKPKSAAARASPLGKGKVTPVQIAFIVERFLSVNNYNNTVSAFRAEASDLFSKTKGKEVPKGLLGLSDILEEYIRLKEQKLMVEQDKRRVEKAFQGLQDVMKTYHSATPQYPLLLQNPDPIGTSNPSSRNGSSQGQGPVMRGSSIIGNVQTPTVPPNIEETNRFSTPVPNCSTSHKRKSSGAAPKVPPAPKKFRTESTATTQKEGGDKLSGKTQCTYTTQGNIGNTPAVQSSSIAKNLFKNPPEGQYNSATQDSFIRNSPEIGTSTSSSPKTPPQALQCQSIENSSLNIASAFNSQKIAPSSCSIISSSERIIISPLKHKGYYAVERSYRVSSSPMKSNLDKSNIREHVKGRLDFEDPDAPLCSEEQVDMQSSPSTDGETAGNFDFDLPDFDFFDGDLSKLLVDIDFECEQLQQSSVPSDILPGCSSEHNLGNGCVGTNEGYQGSPESCLPTMTGIVSQKNMDIQGLDAVTTMRSITKRIMISSPSKPSSSSSSGKSETPAIS